MQLKMLLRCHGLVATFFSSTRHLHLAKAPGRILNFLTSRRIAPRALSLDGFSLLHSLCEDRAGSGTNFFFFLLSDATQSNKILD